MTGTSVADDIILCTLSILLQDENNPCRNFHFNVNLEFWLWSHLSASDKIRL